MSTVVQRPACKNLYAGTGDTSLFHPAELPHELPQVGTRRTTTKTILNQYNKNNTLVDHDRQRRHRNIAKESEDPEATWSFGTSEFAYFRYFQYQKTKDAEITAGFFRDAKKDHHDRTDLRYTRYPTMNFVTEYANSNYSQNRKMMDPELSTSYQLLRKKTTATKIDVTQAGSERFF